MSPPTSQRIGLGLLGLFFGLLLLSQWPALNKGLWIDEYSTLGIAQSGKFWTRTLATNTPPTYYLLVRGLMKLDPGEQGLRLFSLFLFLSSLALTYFSLRPRCGELWAWVGVFWLGTRPTLLYHATEIRAYSLLFFAVALNAYWVQRLEPRKSAWLYLSFLFLLLTHAIGILLMIPLLVLRHLSHPQCPRTRLLAFATVSVAGILLGTFYKPFLAMDWWGDHYLKEGLSRPILQLLGANYSAFGLGSLGLLALLPLLGSRSRFFVATLGILPVAMFALSHFLTSFYLQRTLAPLLFLVVFPVFRVVSRLPAQRTVLGIYLLLGADGLLGWDKVNHLPRFNYKQASQYLDLTTGPGEYLLLRRGDFNRGFSSFYSEAPRETRVALPRRWNREYQKSMDHIQEMLKSGQRFRLVNPLPEFLDAPAANILTDLRERYHYEQFWIGHIQIYEFFPGIPKRPSGVRHLALTRLEDSFEKL